MSANGSDVFEVVREVGSVPTSGGAKLVARLVNVRNKPCLDFRVFVMNSAGESVPTRRGLCIANAHARTVADLAAKLADAAEKESE